MKHIIETAIRPCSCLAEIIPVMEKHNFKFVDSYAVKGSWDICFCFDSKLNDNIKVQLVWNGHKMTVQVIEELE